MPQPTDRGRYDDVKCHVEPPDECPPSAMSGDRSSTGPNQRPAQSSTGYRATSVKGGPFEHGAPLLSRTRVLTTPRAQSAPLTRPDAAGRVPPFGPQHIDPDDRRADLSCP